MRLERTRVLITGAGGFIGRTLASRLRAEDGNLDFATLTRSDVDLADRDRVRAFFAWHRPSKVVHLAASLDRRRAADADERQWRDTFSVGRNVLDAAAETGVAHVLAAGSIEELGDQGGVLEVDLPAQPLTVYGLCKSLVRQVAAFDARAGRMRVDWFRPLTVYGPGQTGPMLVAHAFDLAAKGTPGPSTDGRQERDFVYVDDIVAWLAAGVGWIPDGSGDGSLIVHHLGTGASASVASVLEMIAEEFPGARFELGALPRRSGEPERQVAPCPERATSAPWPWSPRTSVRDGIRATARWWRSIADRR